MTKISPFGAVTTSVSSLKVPGARRRRRVLPSVISNWPSELNEDLMSFSSCRPRVADQTFPAVITEKP